MGKRSAVCSLLQIQDLKIQNMDQILGFGKKWTTCQIFGLTGYSCYWVWLIVSLQDGMGGHTRLKHKARR